jgi:hypothetical protein
MGVRALAGAMDVMIELHFGNTTLHIQAADRVSARAAG